MHWHTRHVVLPIAIHGWRGRSGVPRIQASPRERDIHPDQSLQELCEGGETPRRHRGRFHGRQDGRSLTLASRTSFQIQGLPFGECIYLQYVRMMS